MAANIIQELRKEEADRLLAVRQIPEFRPGDTVRVNVKIKEGERERVQAYEGVVIARGGQGIPDALAQHRIHRGQTPRRRPARQALLPARPPRKVGSHRRAPDEHQQTGRGDRLGRLMSPFRLNARRRLEPSSRRFCKLIPCREDDGGGEPEGWRGRRDRDVYPTNPSRYCGKPSSSISQSSFSLTQI